MHLFTTQTLFMKHLKSNKVLCNAHRRDAMLDRKSEMRNNNNNNNNKNKVKGYGGRNHRDQTHKQLKWDKLHRWQTLITV